MKKVGLDFSRVFLLLLIAGSIGFFVSDDAFGQKYGGSDDNDDDIKQDKNREKEERRNSDREQKGERTDRDKKENDDNKIKEREKKQNKSENQDEGIEEIREQDDNNTLNEDNNSNDDGNDKKQNKSEEEKRAKLESDKKKIEEKLAEKSREFEQKLEKLKEKFQQKITAREKMSSDVSLQSSFSMSSSSAMTAPESEETKKYEKKSENIREKLVAKSEKLDSRTLKILDKINEGKYMGEKINSAETSDSYKLEFDSVTASGIGDKSLTSMMTGNMIFTTFDVGNSNNNLKLQLEECEISVDDIPYNCGFGKARTVSSGDSGEKDSLVIIAFLEDDLIEEVHVTLKIFLNSDMPISQIDVESEQEVSILGPQSKVSHMWFLNGTATLSKFASVSDDDDVVILENIGEESPTSESELSDIEQGSAESRSESSDTEQEEQEEKEETPDDEEIKSN